MSWFRRLFGGADDAVTVVRHLPGRAGLVLDALREVIDPEVGMDVVRLGLIREVSVEGDDAYVRMTLTTRGCPLAEVMQRQVEDAVRGVDLEPRVEMEFDPPWRPTHVG